jgi:hypothetical protein
MYERTPKETEIERYVLDLEDMAENTHKLYFQPLTERP